LVETVRTFVVDVLGPFNTVLGLVAMVPIFWTWWEVAFGRRRRHQRWFKEARTEPGSRPGILIVDLLPDKDIRSNVEHFVQAEPSLRDVPADRNFYLGRATWLTPDDLPALAREIREKSAEAGHAGVDVLHLFYAGPVVPMALIGAELANSCRVQLYQHQQGTFSNWGPLRLLSSAPP
jgi:hypothetical protein